MDCPDPISVVWQVHLAKLQSAMIVAGLKTNLAQSLFEENVQESQARFSWSSSSKIVLSELDRFTSGYKKHKGQSFFASYILKILI